MAEPDPNPPPPDPSPAPAPAPPPPAGGDIIGASGFNYTQRWGSQRGQTGSFSPGSRPVPEGDWNQMTDEEKLATMGTLDGHFLDQMHDEYQHRSQPGGDIYDERVRAFDAIEAASPRSWEDVERALIKAGFNPNINEQGSLFKQLSQIWKGNPLVNNVAQQPQNRSATFRPGFEGIRDYLPGGGESRRFQDWQNESNAAGGNAGTGMLIDPATGLYSDAGHYYDRLGWEVNPRTMQRTGKHYLGSIGGQGEASMPTGLRSVLSGFGNAPNQYADVLSSTTPPAATPPPTPPPAPTDEPYKHRATDVPPPGFGTTTPTPQPVDLASRVQQYVNTISNPTGTPGVVTPTPAAPAQAAPSQPVVNSAAPTQPAPRPGFGTAPKASDDWEPRPAIAQQGWYKKPGFGTQATSW